MHLFESLARSDEFVLNQALAVGTDGDPEVLLDHDGHSAEALDRLWSFPTRLLECLGVRSGTGMFPVLEDRNRLSRRLHLRLRCLRSDASEDFLRRLAFRLFLGFRFRLWDSCGDRNFGFRRIDRNDFRRLGLRHFLGHEGFGGSSCGALGIEPPDASHKKCDSGGDTHHFQLATPVAPFLHRIHLDRLFFGFHVRLLWQWLTGISDLWNELQTLLSSRRVMPFRPKTKRHDSQQSLRRLRTDRFSFRMNHTLQG